MDDELSAERRLWADLHRVLLRLAGRVPDEGLAFLRRTLAGGTLDEVAEMVAGEAVDRGLPLPAADVGVLRAAGGSALLDMVDVADAVPESGHAFVDEPAGRAPDWADHAALVWSRDPAVVAIGRSLRDGSTPVYVVEVAPGAAAWDIAREMMEAMSPEGAPPPVEVYWSGEPLGPYQRDARAHATMLWQRAAPAGAADPAGFVGAPAVSDPPAAWPAGPDTTAAVVGRDFEEAAGLGSDGRADAAVARAIEAARAGDIDGMRSIVDWPLTGAPRVFHALRAMDPADRAGAVAEALRNLAEVGDRPERVARPVRQLVDLLAAADSVTPAEGSRLRSLLAQFDISRFPPDGLGDGQAAEIDRLRARAAALSEVRLVQCGPESIPLAYAADTDRLVAVFV